MDIIGHLIQDTEIIGIGPLYTQPSKDLALRSLYNSQRFIFNVHTKHNSIEIASHYFMPGPPDMKNEDERNKMRRWEDDYYKARQLIADQIGEIIPEQK